MSVADLVVRDAAPPTAFGTEARIDVVVRGGVIAAADRGAADGVESLVAIDADGGMVTPAFVEAHWHADKFESLAGGSHVPAGPERVRALRAGYTVADVAARAERGMRLALAQGVTRARVTVDVSPAVGFVALEGVLVAREAIGSQMTIQLCALPEGAVLQDTATRDLVEESFRMGIEVLGAYPNGAGAVADGLAELDAAFAMAERLDVPLDVHVDEEAGPDQVMLEPLAERVLARGWGDRVLADHAVALETYAAADRDRIVNLVARAGLPVCVMPNNLSWEPQARGGLGMVRRLREAGVTVCAGTDNANDGYFAFGNLDPVERAYLVALGGALENEDAAAIGWDMVGASAAAAIGVPHGSLEVGGPADLVVFAARGIVEAMRRLPGRRTVIRAGRVVAGAEGSIWTEGAS